MSKLENKIAVITGGSTGIGLATAKTFIAQGAKVLITGRSEENLANAKKELGENVITLKSDTSKLADIERLKDYIEVSIGKIDILFLNAGIAKFFPAEALPEDTFDDLININFKGLFFTYQKLLPLLNDGASVILTTSGVNTKGLPGSSVYAATKAAVRSLARTFASEAAHRNIRVNAISPGPIETPIYDKMGMSEEELNGFAQQIQQSVPLNRFGVADEIAKAALFLAASDSSYVTGTELVADGGFTQV
ncbi:SDR family oxidoreductase [Flexithrix dorotheae]|uniref:SDR family oxidoreductase n=1 Tax=Flexithrix dorotheae TaxID=70993 RepID=UPI00036B2BFB|nr:SDR family oxidoreductase [Flexithrix dorotheae]